MLNNTKKTLYSFLSFSLKYKKSGIFFSLLIILASIINSVVPVFYKTFFNQIAQNVAKNEILNNLINTLFIIAFLLFLRWLFWRVASFLIADFKSRTIYDLGNHCFSYIHKHSFSYFNDTFTGSLVKRIKSYTRAFEIIVDQIVFELLPLFFNTVVIFIVLYQNNIWLSVGIGVWIIIFLFITAAFTKYKLKYDLERNLSETQNTSIIADTIINHANIKLFNGYRFEINNFKKSNNDLRKKVKITWNLGNIYEAIQAFFTLLLEVGTFFFALYLWQRNKLTIGDFVLIQTYLVTIYNQFWNFGRVIRRIYEALSDAEEMTVILNTPHEITNCNHAKTLCIKKCQIDFRNINFSYTKNRQIISGLNLTIHPKEKVALVGPSGAGKTTITKLLLRFYDTDNGQILIDGQNIKSVTQESLRANISLVPQDPILFHRSLIDNIRYGCPEATYQEVVRASKAAHCHEFISKLPDKYNTFTGERGVKLSGGERQRIAIARTILCKTPILILDEAMSNLDSESENLIQDTLNRYMKNKTVIIIAHQLSSVKNVDRIIVINKGKIIEEGTHVDLSKINGGAYQKFWKIQSNGFDIA